MNKLAILFSLLVGVAHAQTNVWVKVANEGQTVAFVVSTQVRYGTTALTTGNKYCSAAGCWETATETGSMVAANSSFPADPAPYYGKELDVLETGQSQTVVVDGKAVSVPANAAPPVVAPPIVIPPAQPPIVVPPAAPTPVKTWSCTGTVTYSLMSDGTFSVANAGALTCKVNP